MKEVKEKKKQRFLRTPGRRGAAVNAFAAVVALAMMLVIMVHSGMMPGVSSSVDADRAAAAYWDKVKSSIEGTIYDRNGTVLCTASEKGKPGTLTYPESTSFLLGYNSNIYGQSALRKMYYKDVLLNTDKNGKGGSLNLTLDIDLQNYCQSQLRGHEGAIIVMNWKTGALLAAASNSDPNITFNANEIDEKWDVYNRGNFWYNRCWLVEDPPGSTQKIITAACALEHGEGDFKMDDSGKLDIGGASIHNFGNGVYGSTDLQSAMTNSVNTYFAALSLRLGQAHFLETQEKFLYNVPISDLDFTEQTLTSSVSLTTQASLAMAGFGQGTLSTSPLHLALGMGGVMNGGEIVQPYLVENATIKGKTKHQHKPETLSKDCISKANAETLRSYLHVTALAYGFDEATCGTAFAKTGTADDSRGTNHIYCLAATGDYVVLVSISHTHSASGLALPLTKNVLSYVHGMQS